jgi:hypothetical protein
MNLIDIVYPNWFLLGLLVGVICVAFLGLFFYGLYLKKKEKGC